jgi:LysR family transcriptional regulator, low CO2-responsive transcriptional regulator
VKKAMVSQTDCRYHYDRNYLSPSSLSLDCIEVSFEKALSVMDIDHIETFLAVVSHGGFHRAARALRVSQPAVSARIRLLEGTLGAPLFRRSPGNVTLTAAGKALLPHAERMIRDVASARQAVYELQPTAAGALSIGAAFSICTYLLPDVLQKFQAAQPNVIVTMRSGNSAQVLKMVLDGEVDLGLARSLNHPEVQTIQLREDPLMLVGHPSLLASRKRRVRLEELESIPLISYDRASSDWTLMNGLFRRAGLLPNVVLEVATIETCKQMVLRRLGLGFLPLIAVLQEIRNGKLKEIELINCEPLNRSLDVIHQGHRPLRSCAQDFLKVLRQTTQEQH